MTLQPILLTRDLGWAMLLDLRLKLKCRVQLVQYIYPNHHARNQLQSMRETWSN